MFSLFLVVPVVISSPGCGEHPPVPHGQTETQTLHSSGYERSYELHVPSNYDKHSETPLVLDFHGWGGDGKGAEVSTGFSTLADSETFIAVFPNGMKDQDATFKRRSWNGGGTSEGTGPDGPTCSPSAPTYCYDSCIELRGSCAKCSWTTCVDDIQFVSSLLDHLENKLCIDPARIYVSGFSNGGTFTYALGQALHTRLAAIVPGGGTPHPGFVTGPVGSGSSDMSILDYHGSSDTVCPPNSTEPSKDGWFYSQVDETLSAFVSRTVGCNSTVTGHYPTAGDGQKQWWCKSLADCGEGVDIVRCSWDGGHTYPSFGGWFSQVVWSFMKAHPKKSKLSLKTANNSVSL